MMTSTFPTFFAVTDVHIMICSKRSFVLRARMRKGIFALRDVGGTHLYVICLCCHFCPVRAYRRFLTLNFETPAIWSGTPHLGFFIHLQETVERCCYNWQHSQWLYGRCFTELYPPQIKCLASTNNKSNMHEYMTQKAFIRRAKHNMDVSLNSHISLVGVM